MGNRIMAAGLYLRGDEGQEVLQEHMTGTRLPALTVESDPFHALVP